MSQQIANWLATRSTIPSSIWPADRRNSNDPFGDNNEIPLEHVNSARRSTETTRSNGFQQFTPSTKQQRIIEDIRDGNQICSVCLEVIRFAPNRSLWHCKTCYNVLHYHCAESCASAPRSLLNPSWRCPQCSTPQGSAPDGKCWCGRGSGVYDHATIPNACHDGICHRSSKCIHGTPSHCDKPCHPGPCNYPCGRCINDPIPIPPNPYTRRGRFKLQEWNAQKTFGTLILMLGWFAGITCLMYYHIKWHTQPYKYPNFKEQYLPIEYILGFVLLVVYGVLGSKFYMSLCLDVTFFWGRVINGIPGKAGYRYRPFCSLCANIFLICVFLAAFAYPIVGIAAGPDLHWYYQMKDSCKGYDTRIRMGTNEPNSVYNLTSLNQTIGRHQFYLAPLFAPRANSNEQFQYFHRFSGNTRVTDDFAVDVDINNGVWRFVNFDGTDQRTKWIAEGRKASKFLPSFNSMNETVTESGRIEYRNGHIYLPEAEMVIHGAELGREHREIEPFIRVYDVQEKSESGIAMLMSKNWRWSPKDDKNILMRTASFGHGRQRLDMCVKEDFYITESENDGLGDWSILPLAVIAAHRMRSMEMGTLDSIYAYRKSRYLYD